jgi:hypothetical protein
MATDNPYEKELRKQRTAAGLQGAATGASLGASVGSAVYPGVGTLIGAGVGAIGGGLVGALGYQDDPLQVAQLKELEELQRRQELGMLGLTDAERAQLEAELIDPMRATRREQQLQFQQGLQGADVGAGSFFKMGIGQEQRAAQQEQTVRDKIEARNLQEVATEEARIYELLGEESKRQASAREANLQSVEAFGGVAQTYAADQAARAENDAFAEEENYYLGIMQDASQTPEARASAQQSLDFARYFYGEK